MPEIRTYEVTKVMKVKVNANTLLDAQLIAEKAFTEHKDKNVPTEPPEPNWGYAHSEGVKDVAINVEQIR